MTAQATASQTRLRRYWGLDLAAVALLLAAALIGFWPTFAGPSFVLAVLGGIVLGLGVAALCAWRGFGILLVTAGTIVVYFLFGGAFALPHTTLFGVIPTIDTLGALAVGVITSWKQLLTTVAPVSAADGHLLVPFLVALLGAVVAGSLALRLRQAAWALLPVVGALFLSISLGTPTSAFPLAQGIAIAAIATVWMSLRSWLVPQHTAVDVAEGDPLRTAHMRTRRLVGSAVVIAVAAAAGVGVNALVDQNGPRQVLRDSIVPPFNIRDYASPMQSFRKTVRDQKTKTLFTVSGLPKDTRVRIAAMDAWDGVVYNVADGGTTSSSAFLPLRSDMAADAEGVPATLDFEVGDYSGVWLPSVSHTDDITFTGSRAEELRRSAYSNPGTNTTVVAAGLKKGDTYRVDAIVSAQPSDAELKELDFANIRQKKSPYSPNGLSSLASEAVVDAETPIDQARALEQLFAEGGFFSHGLEGDVLSRAGHTAERISTLIGGDQMVGDDEQYSAAMALAAGELGIPARVVMGYYPDSGEAGTFKATGDDLHAWVEIAFDKVGWVAFDPTPPEDKVPQDQNTKPRVDPKPQVLQPPPPPQDPVDLPPTVPDDRKAEDESANLLGIIGMILAIAGIALGILLLLASPFLVIGAWKAARRRARRNAERTSDRISGAWHEFTDRAVDHGARIAPGATRVEQAGIVASALDVPAATALATRADGQVFGPGEPSSDEVDGYWRDVDAAVSGMRANAGFWGRVKARLSLRSLRISGRIRASMQNVRDAATARIRREDGNIDSNESTPESETS